MTAALPSPCSTPRMGVCLPRRRGRVPHQRPPPQEPLWRERRAGAWCAVGPATTAGRALGPGGEHASPPAAGPVRAAEHEALRCTPLPPFTEAWTECAAPLHDEHHLHGGMDGVRSATRRCIPGQRHGRFVHPEEHPCTAAWTECAQRHYTRRLGGGLWCSSVGFVDASTSSIRHTHTHTHTHTHIKKYTPSPHVADWAKAEGPKKAGLPRNPSYLGTRSI